MSTLMDAIRHATGGAGKPRSEDEKPDKMENEEKETSSEEERDKADAADEEKETEAEGDRDEPDAAENENEEETDEEGEREAAKLSGAEREAFANGRKAERNRLSKILGSKAAAANPALAAHLAFATVDPAGKAVAALKAAGPAASSEAGGLASRMNARSPSKTGRGGEDTVRSKDASAAWSGPLAKAGVKLKGN